jgi:hypothetical protein
LLVEVYLLYWGLLAILAGFLRGLRGRGALLLVRGPRCARGERIKPSDIFESDDEAAMDVIIIILSIRVLHDARVSHVCGPDQRRNLSKVYAFPSISIEGGHFLPVHLGSRV